MLKFALSISAILAGPALEEVHETRVFMLEDNTVYDHDGKEVLHQLLGWDYDVELQRRVVVFWRLLKHDSQVPTRCRGGFKSEWRDGDHLVRVRANARYTSWTQCDPEIENRMVFPKHRRREIFTPDRPNVSK